MTLIDLRKAQGLGVHHKRFDNPSRCYAYSPVPSEDRVLQVVPRTLEQSKVRYLPTRQVDSELSGHHKVGSFPGVDSRAVIRRLTVRDLI